MATHNMAPSVEGFPKAIVVTALATVTGSVTDAATRAV